MSARKKAEAEAKAEADAKALAEIKDAAAKADKARIAAEKAASEAKAEIKKLASKGASSKANLTQKYAVQVAAYEIDGKSINMSEYKDLFKEGNVYSRPSGKHIKIRVGVYDSKALASKHLKAIKKAGFKQAFITKEYLEPTKADKSLMVKSTTEKSAPAEKVVKAPKLTPKKKKVAPKKKTTKKKTTPKKSAKKSHRQYYVQLAAYKNVKYFPRAKVAPLGKIVNTKNNKYTTMYITGFDSLEEAIDARNKALKIGFRRPYIVYKRNGKFVRMKF